MWFDVTKFGDTYDAAGDKWEKLHLDHYYCFVYASFLAKRSQQVLPPIKFAKFVFKTCKVFKTFTFFFLF